jgi:hypothetical protein
VYSGYKSLARCIAGKDFLPFYGQPLQFGDHFLNEQEIIKMDRNQGGDAGQMIECLPSKCRWY